ncbi:MAG TPA: hypothetical protein VNB90_13770 [Cytophagaceae bacterium]|nr:hypothetical protein [Cytophagaceae bacterium]
MRKNIRLVLISLFCLLVINSCCTKKKCASPNYDVYFCSFTQADADTVIVFTYDPNSNYTNYTDSSMASWENDTVVASCIADLQHNYKLRLPATGEEFYLDNFTTAKRACNDCFPYHPKSEYQEYLFSYQLNGKTIIDSELRIQK